MNPALSTVHQPAFELGEIAAEKLIELIESKKPTGPDDYETRILDTRINMRASTAQAR
jgi:LacI family transcriptional regulator